MGGMDDLSLQVAAGILIAAVIMAGARWTLSLIQKGSFHAAFWLGLNVTLLGGALILAGMGTIPW